MKDPCPVKIPDPVPFAATPGPASAAVARDRATSTPMRILTGHLREGGGTPDPRLASILHAFRFAETA